MTNGASNVIKQMHLTNAIVNLLDSSGFSLTTMTLEGKLDKKIETFTQEVYQILGLLLNPLQLNLL